MSSGVFHIPGTRRAVACKFCNSNSDLFGAVDSNKSCEDHRKPPLPRSGIVVSYYRCRRCGLIFTPDFDHYSKADFLAKIYNEGYAAVDPEYAESRPASNAKMLSQIFVASKGISILDYGGGNGTLAAKLRIDGFTDVQTHDPFVSEFSARPSRQFDLVVSFEVAEHSPKPISTFDDLTSMVKPSGIIIFSTLLQPPDISAVGVRWWYLSPRNGHVTFYNAGILSAYFKQKGMKFGSLNSNLHLAWRKIPPFANHFIRE